MIRHKLLFVNYWGSGAGVHYVHNCRDSSSSFRAVLININVSTLNHLRYIHFFFTLVTMEHLCEIPPILFKRQLQSQLLHRILELQLVRGFPLRKMYIEKQGPSFPPIL
ncbi:hypothetical protein LINPERPRIM_LOCUS13972 [Linum perenne]